MTLKKFKPLLKRLKREAAEEEATRRHNLAGACPKIKNIHPFPARMGMDIVWDALKEAEEERRMATRSNEKAL